MLCRRNRNGIAGDIQPKLLALLGNVGEVLQDQVPRLVAAGSISHSRLHIFQKIEALSRRWHKVLMRAYNQRKSHYTTAAVSTSSCMHGGVLRS